MKKMILIFSIVAALFVGGCKTTSFFVIDDDNKEHQPTGTFNDETYIWETWFYSTNTVNEVR
jgi:hypothetical protein